MNNFRLFIELAALAVVFSGLPLSYVWMKREYGFFEKLNWLLVFMTFDLIIFGAFTRLTDSGLGCPDWPGCYGTSNPWHALGDIQLAQAAFPTGPVSVMKAWIEMVHRYLAMTVGTLIVVQLLIAWSKVKVLGKSPFLGSVGLLLLVCIQGAFGAWTVTLKLQPIIVSTHLLLALMLLACLTAYANQSCFQPSSSHLSSSHRLLPRMLVTLAIVVLSIQIFLGAWVSTNYAVLACPDFPTCLGTFWPQMEWQEGFTFWRKLGLTAQGEYISPLALQTIHWTHRVFAILTVLVLVVLFAVSWRVWTSGLPQLKNLSRLLGALIALQILTGVSNVVFQWPLLAALMHTGGAAALVFCLVRMIHWSSWKSSIPLR